jgi:hypothetical protein
MMRQVRLIRGGQEPAIGSKNGYQDYNRLIYYWIIHMNWAVSGMTFGRTTTGVCIQGHRGLGFGEKLHIPPRSRATPNSLNRSQMKNEFRKNSVLKPKKIGDRAS